MGSFMPMLATSTLLRAGTVAEAGKEGRAVTFLLFLKRSITCAGPCSRLSAQAW